MLWILWTTLVLAAQTTYVSGYGLGITPCVQGCGLWTSDCPQALSTGYPPVIHRVHPPSGDNPSRALLTFGRPFDHSSDVSTVLPHVLPRGYPQTVDSACEQRVAIWSLVTDQSPSVFKSWHKRGYPQAVSTPPVGIASTPLEDVCTQPVDYLGTELWKTYGHKRLDPSSTACGHGG